MGRQVLNEEGVLWRKKVLGVWIYISRRRMKLRQKRDNKTYEERRTMWKECKKPLMELRGWRCEICGKDITDGGEIHHVLPYARFPELEWERRNMMCLCHECHREIHLNPYYNIRLQEEKGEEIGVNVKEIYAS